MDFKAIEDDETIDVVLVDEQGKHRYLMESCTKSSFKESFPLLYKAAEELDAAVGEGLLSDNDLAILEKGLSNSMTEEEIKRCKKGIETTLHIKREFNELIQSKRAFAKLASTGFCVTLSGPADGAAVLTTETDAKKMEALQRKKQAMTKVPEIRNRMRKTLETRHSDIVVAPKTSSPKPQKKLVVEEIKASPVAKTPPVSSVQMSNEIDVDELVQLIEGTHIKTDPNPKKAAKKARQKERKEQERQRLAEEKAKEEAARRAEELRKQEEERKKVELEKKKKAAEEQRQKEELQRKQREAAEAKKEEQRRKKEELERRKAEEKRLKKEAKKQRREQRKKELELEEAKESGGANPSESLKVDPAASRADRKSQPVSSPEKEYGRLKHEKEQRKRDEEEARRLQELQAQEKLQASRKSKKKKKKQKSSTENENSVEPTPDALPPSDSGKSVPPVGQPLLEILNTAPSGEGQGKTPEEKNNLVTIKKHMDSSVTISMKGKKGENDMVYTLVNGQVFPTSLDSKVRGDEAIALQNTVMSKPESTKMTGVPNVAITSSNGDFLSGLGSLKNMNPPQHHAPKHNNPGSSITFTRENTNLTEIDLSQLKLPPGITITKVPQTANGSKFNHAHSHPHSNGIHHPTPDYNPRPISNPGSDYQRSTPMVGYNANAMAMDGRCPSMDSPHCGRNPEMMYGACGTRPSSETSIASDRPSSGMDSLYNNGPSPFVSRVGYPGAEAFGKRVPISMSSPFATSRNETPSPAWQADMNAGVCGMGGYSQHGPSITPDRHGFWSSSPASPVTFPPKPVSESYMRAQDQQFIKPRPQLRQGYYDHGKVASPSLYGSERMTPAMRKAAVPEFKPIGMNSSGSSYEQVSMAMNGSPLSGIGPIGFNSVAEPMMSQPRVTDQWTPWSNGDRFSPDVPSMPSNMTHMAQTTHFSLSDILSVNELNDRNDMWEPESFDKLNLSGSVNPYGPIGSNISRRPSNAATNGHGKLGEALPTVDASRS